jgi:Helix-turn-helix of DDE superfamily endonuclease
MKWKEIKNKSVPVFKRLVGVTPSTFAAMAAEISKQSAESKHKIIGKKRGPKSELCVEDKLLMMLMYYREYRTFLHISADYGISETQCWRIVTSLERMLLQSKLFHLPGKKVLQQANTIEMVLVDVAETPIERPKKNSETIIQGRKKDIR